MLLRKQRKQYTFYASQTIYKKKNPKTKLQSLSPSSFVSDVKIFTIFTSELFFFTKK